LIICPASVRSLADRPVPSSLGPFGQQGLEHVEFDNARLGLRRALAQIQERPVRRS
jgi:hypothetical protein